MDDVITANFPSSYWWAFFEKVSNWLKLYLVKACEILSDCLSFTHSPLSQTLIHRRQVFSSFFVYKCLHIHLYKSSNPRSTISSRYYFESLSFDGDQLFCSTSNVFSDKVYFPPDWLLLIIQILNKYILGERKKSTTNTTSRGWKNKDSLIE